MFGVAPPPGSYCDTCMVFGPVGEPCWVCGRTDLLTKSVPTGGHRNNPDALMARVEGVEVPVD